MVFTTTKHATRKLPSAMNRGARRLFKRLAREYPTAAGYSARAVTGGVLTSQWNSVAGGGERGGDWLDAFPLPNGLFALSIGDVSGHGEKAYQSMTLIRDVVRNAAASGLDPTQILAEANAFLCRSESKLFATAIFGVLDARRGSFTFANAGHPPPLLAGLCGSNFINFGIGDLPLGIYPTLTASLRTVIIPAATLLILYTDGVTEHQRDPLEGEARLGLAAVWARLNLNASPATTIAGHIGLDDCASDDATILAAWISGDDSRLGTDRRSELRVERR